jgi:ketosteroid isomerase-like protein
MPPAKPLTAAGAVDAPSSAMTDDMAKASATLDRFHAAAAAADETAYFALFAEGGVFLGTDGKERWTVPEFRAYAHPRFASGKAWSFRSTRRDLSVRGDVAWFDEDLATPNLGPARGSGALVRDAQGGWKVAQYNLSIPIPNERFADVKTVIEGGGLPCKPKKGDPGF